MKRLLTALLLSAAAYAEPGLQFEQVQKPAQRPAVPKRPAITRLATADLLRLLSRLPALPRPARTADPVLRPGPLPPPATRLTLPFPAPDQESAPPRSPSEPVKVVSSGPNGEVDVSAEIRVTFNQPMLALGETRPVPATLTPAVEGEWHWVGTRAAVFRPKNRLPKATTFKAEAAGTSWTFSTPSPCLVTSYPTGGKVAVNPVIFLAFDQRVSALEVLKRLEFSGPELRLATPQEIEADQQVKALVKECQPDYWLALVPQQPLLPATPYSLRLPPGIPSLEGTRTTTRDYSSPFTTYRPLVVDRNTESAGPGETLLISFNNDLVPDQKIQVSATPEIADLRARVRDGNLWVKGRTRARTEYQLTVAAGLVDIFGQRLSAPVTLPLQIQAAQPQFTKPKQFLVLDPEGPPQLNFSCVNQPELAVRIFAVKPEDRTEFELFRQHGNPGPGELIVEERVTGNTLQDEVQEIKVDLRRALEKSSQLVVEVISTGEQYSAYRGWVQRTRLGANLAYDADQLLVWVTDLASGRSVPEARVSFLGSQDSVSSDAQGLARLPSSSKQEELVVRKGDDQLLVTTPYLSHADRPEDQAIWYVTDDRLLYKPGETVFVKGWIRRQINQPQGQLEAITDPLTFQLQDRQNNKITEGQVQPGRLGGFDFQLNLPKEIDLGQASLKLKCAKFEHVHHFKVEEFRRPEFEVSAHTETPPAVLGGTGALAVDALYYAGGGLKNAAVRWDVEARPTVYHPPHWSEFTFDTWRPWWHFESWWLTSRAEAPNRKTFPGSTDARGRHQLDLKFLSADEPRPYSVQAVASVSDVNRQTWTSGCSLLVHPANLYVGLKSGRTFVQPGQPLETQLVATDLEGRAVPGRPLELTVFHLNYGRDKEQVFNQKLTSGPGPVTVSVPTKEGGVYQLEARVSDEQNRVNRCELTCWVAGGMQPPPKRDVEMQQLTLVPNKKVYQPGEVAEILVESGAGRGQALVTLERHGLVSHQLLDLSSGSNTLRIPLEEGYIPNLHVTVDAVGSTPRADSPKPHPMQAQAQLDLEVSSQARRLSVEVSPRQPITTPGSSNVVEVAVKDWQGHPAAHSEVALWAVDESVLALAEGEYPDPINLFYQHRDASVSHLGMRQWIELALAGELEVAPKIPPASVLWTSSTGAAGAVNITFEEAFRSTLAVPLNGGFQAAGPFELIGNLPQGIGAFQGFHTVKTIQLRQNFTPLALFKPNLTTNADGKARVTFQLPDNLTRYRIVALAAQDHLKFGKGESALVARQPLMIRPSPPRFLNFGDRCELPIVVQNQTDRPLTVQLACRAVNLNLANQGAQVKVPANDRVEVRFPVSTDRAGPARLQVAATSGALEDAADIKFPVLTPATSEAAASYGVIDGDNTVRQPVLPPPDTFPNFGGLEVSTSSTALAELTDAFLYLQRYPYECAEQRASRVLASVALAPVLQAFGTTHVPGPSRLKLQLESDLKKLDELQNSDGGWDYWERDRPSDPYCSVHVTHALIRLRQAGYEVSDKTYEKALEYVASSATPHQAYATWCKLHVNAYAIYVLHRAGRPQITEARRLLKEYGGVQSASLEALGWLLPTLSQEPEGESIRQHLHDQVTQTASTANFTTKYREDSHLILASDRRDDAILLEALCHDSPQSELLPKLVRGLLSGRRCGRWENTQENCFVLLALHEYFQKFERLTPDFVARVWLGEKYGGEQPFRGRDQQTRELRVPMSELTQNEDLQLTKQGPGRLYYRLGLQYAPLSLQLPALERGFSVERLYAGADDEEDVRRDAQGNWHIRSGARVRVSLTMVAPTPRHHVALVDPLPAGLEADSPALGPLAHSTWQSRWYDHDNLRDDRIEAFAGKVDPGVHSYTYFARATTPGNFVVPPARAEEMYHPETFGRSSTDRVTVAP